ncbi:unnamed protein product [Oppiella nova]|uniref:Uncharacterized protein n=1 Tax=Oppiella nova TaxID=334625 RepID=A0A7R9M137_9ACAR|nr:unnamed protein product [Oppiella nova]CAG2168329.1 unnamed protein product [Oppiella nova]
MLLAVFKYGCHEMLLLRQSLHYNMHTDYWTWVSSRTAIIVCEIERKNGYEYYLDCFGPILKEILYDISTNS